VPLVTDDELLIVGVRDCAVHKNTSNTSSFLSPLSSSVQVCVCVCVYVCTWPHSGTVVHYSEGLNPKPNPTNPNPTNPDLLTLALTLTLTFGIVGGQNRVCKYRRLGISGNDVSTTFLLPYWPSLRYILQHFC